MKKRSLTLLLTLALSAASAQSASTGNAISVDPRLSKANVTFKIVRDGTGLMALLTAVAKAAGYELILDPGLDSLITPSVGSGSGVSSSEAVSAQTSGQSGASSTLLTYDFIGKPFNQVWPFLMDVYSLNYEVVRLGNQDVLRVSKNPIQMIIALPKTLDAAKVEERVKLAFGSRQAPSSTSTATSTPASPGEIVLDSATLKIVGEPSSNSLIIRGSNQEVLQVETLVKQIVASQPPELAKVVVPVSPVIQYIYNVKGAQADAATLLKEQFPAITVTSVGQTGQLVLSGQKTQIDAALELLGKVDKPVQAQSGPDLAQQIYTAKGDPKDIAAVIAAQFPALKATPVGVTNQLILSGPQPQLNAALNLLAKVDIAPPAPAPVVPEVKQQIYTAKGDPKDITAVIAAQFPALKATPVGVTNQLILSGPQPQLDLALTLLAKVDIAPPVPEPVIPEVKQQIYTSKGDPKDITALIAAQFPALKATAVGSSNQLILSGPQPQLDSALAVLKQVDLAPSVQTNPELQQRVYSVKGDQKDIAALLGAQFPALKITPVGTTGQLVLNGPRDLLDAATTLLGQVDKPVTVTSGPAVVQKVFQLINASAEELKTVLEGTLQRDLPTPAPQGLVPVTAVDASGNPTTVVVRNPAADTAAATAASASSASSQTAAEANAVTIIADKRTNTLIVRGTEAQVAQVAALIPSLDQVVPQINVQVRIQEITEDAARTLGLNWKVGFGGFNISTGSTGLAASFDPTRALVGGFNLLPTLNALETQTKTKRIYDGSITMQSGQRSLSGTSGAATNASSTAAASIKSGGRLELNIPSVSGNITKQIDYGINLDFFDPQVAPDGTITLRVRGQVNQPKTAITGSDVPNVLDFSNSEAQSIVTFKSGQTLLMSGLLGTNESTTNRGVPYLSSLPVIGPAFGQKETTKTQSQLMVVITGTVVK